MKSIFLAAAALVAISSAAAAQPTTPYRSDNQPAANQDPNKIVCEAEEQIGSRLGKKKVCLTVQEWRDKHNEHREFTDTMQSGAWPPSGNDPANVPGGASPP